MNKNILIIGSGGREHALAWKLKQSPQAEKIYIAPGNAGTASLGENVAIKATEVFALADFAQKNSIDLTIVGPDDALALGVVDEFQSRGLKIFGPTKAVAQIESSKAFAKELMAKYSIPTADFKTFSDYNEALKYLEQKGAPIVIKASGLALGKGVTVCKTLDEAKQAVKAAMLDKTFGDAGSQVVIEEFLEGREFSVHAFCDGASYKLLPTAQDHKAVYDGDTGPNTGGMGTVTPLPWVNEDDLTFIKLKIIEPILKALKENSGPFVGLLYPGLIKTKDGIKVIEFNARFGDPETQSYMRLLETDLVDILDACVYGKLDELSIDWSDNSACCVVMASQGYPGEYKKGLPISGIEEAEKLSNVVVFHGGTVLINNQLVANGGRVLGVTATGENLKSALDKAYSAIKLINFEGAQFRKDIGAKSLLTTTH